MNDLVQCPACVGKGGVYGFVDGRNPETGKWWGGVAWCPCGLCGETGNVTAERVSAYTKGRRMRDERVAAGLSLRERARQLGITALELSELERGQG